MKKLFMMLILTPSFCSAASTAQQLMATDSATRDSAQQDIASFTPEQLKPVINELVHDLKKDDIDSREHAAEALGLLGPAAKPAMVPLRNALNDDLPFVRIHSAEALAKIGPESIPVFIDALKNRNGETRTFAAKTLGNFGQSAKEAIPNLIAAMRDPELSVRGSAIVALGKMGPSAAAAIPALRAAAGDSDSGVADKAAEVLNKIEAVTIGKKPIPAKVATPPHTTAPVEVDVAEAIMPPAPPKKKPAPVPHKDAAKTKKKKALPPPPPPTMDELMVLLQSTETSVHMGAELGLIQRSSESVPVLITVLQGANTSFAQISAALLDKIGTDDAKKAVETYRHHLSDKRTTSLLKDLRQEGKQSQDAMIELVKIGEPIVKPVSQMLNDPRPTTRHAAATVLNRLGKVSQPATPMLIDALDDKDADVRQQAAEALTKIGTPEAQKALRFFPIKDKFYRLIGKFRS